MTRGYDLPAAAIVAAAAVLRFWDLGRRSLWLDEAWAAVRCLDGPFDVAHVGNTPLVFAGLIRMSVAVVGRSEFAVRLPAALFSIGAVVLAYRMGCALAGRAEGRLSAALVGLLPLPVYYGKEMKPYATELFLALGIACLVARLWRVSSARPGLQLGRFEEERFQ